MSLLEHSVATHTINEAVRLLKEGHSVRHKRFVKGAFVYLDARGKLTDSLRRGGPSLLEPEDLMKVLDDLKDGWIDQGFRHGDAAEARKWMEAGGVARRAPYHPDRFDHYYVSGTGGHIALRLKSGHEQLLMGRSVAEWVQGWHGQRFILLPPTCKKLTYEELRRHLENGGRWAFHPNSSIWWFRRDGNDLFYDLAYDKEEPSKLGPWCKGLTPNNLERIHLLPPLEAEKPEPAPALGAKTNATPDEAQKWLDTGGEVAADGCGCRFRKEGDAVVNVSGDSTFSFDWHNTCYPTGKYTLLPMDKPKTETTLQPCKMGKTRAEQQQVIEHLKKGGSVKLVKYNTAYRLVDGKLRFRDLDEPEEGEQKSSYAGVADFSFGEPERYELLPIPEPEPTDKPRTIEDVIAHWRKGGRIRFSDNAEYWLEGDRVMWAGCATDYRPVESVLSLSDENKGNWFYLDDLATVEFLPVPEPAPPTRVEVIEHLRAGGKVQWKDGIPGVWTAFAGILLWTPQGGNKPLFSHHNCNGHWFADFADDEISYLELLPIEKPETATKATQEQVNSWERALLDWLRVPASSCPGRRTLH